MKSTDVVYVSAWKGSSLTNMARILGQGAANITQASLTSIAYAVTDRASGATTASGAVTISSSVFDTLQTADARWIAAGGDGTGYGFLHTVGAAAFVAGRRRYRVVYTFTPATGDPFFFVVEALSQDPAGG